jgi:hypothetical protein
VTGKPASRPSLLCLMIFVAVAAASQAQETHEGFSPPIGAADYEDLAQRLEQAEAELARRVLGPVPYLTSAELQPYESLHREIQASYYGELVDRSRFLILLARAQTVSLAAAQPGPLPKPPHPNLERPARILLAAGVASFCLSYSLWALAERQDSLYLASSTVDEALVHRRLFQTCGLASLILAGVGTVSSGASVSLLLAGGR